MRASHLLRKARRAERAADAHEAEAAIRPSRRRLPFGDEWVRTILPHYFTAAESADFHTALFARLTDFHATRDNKEAVVAPREGAKSTVVTLAYVLYCACEGVEPFPLILSDSAGQAQDRLREVRHEVETNPAIAEHYPAVAGEGDVWRNDRIRLRNGVTVAAFGTGQRVRGRRANQARPSLVVFDDCENNTTITSPTKRAAAWRWATREVIPAGTNGTNFLSVGSALHRECVAVRLGRLPGWAGHTYKAVHRWPDRMDLWDDWERLATNWADDDRNATSAAFYETNRAAMDAGAAVYWPARWPLYSLMKRRAEIGAAAFDTEYQGVPAVEGLAAWPAEWLDDRPQKPFWFDDWPPDDQIVYSVFAVDPSKGGGARTNDYQGLALIRMTRGGDLYVECWMLQGNVLVMVERAVELAGRAAVNLLIVENNEGLGMIEPEINAVRARLGYAYPVEAFRNTVNKELRIEDGLGRYLRAGRLRFRRTPGTRLAVDQARDFPNGEHDDGPDSVELGIGAIERRYGVGRRR